MLSLGHRTGLFDVMARIEPGDSTAIAKAGNLDERYVREWLGAMVTGRIVDIGCGSGRALTLMASSFPKSRFCGYDISQEGIAAANAMAKEKGLSNLSFEVRDISGLDNPNAFDLVTAFDVIHDQAKPAAVLEAVASILRPGGTFLMQDIAGTSHVHEDIEHPIGPFLYAVSCMHCMTVSLSAGGAGLGAMWGEETARRMLAEAGFDSVDLRSLPDDVTSYFYLSQKRS